MGMDEASALVRALCSSRVHRVSRACSVCQCLKMLAVSRHGRCKSLGTCFVLEPLASCVMSLQHVLLFQYAGCAWAWTRRAS